MGETSMNINDLALPGTLSGWLKQLGVALLYLLFGYLIHHNFTDNGIVSVIWPGSGLALAALLIGGRRYIWGVLFGALLLNASANDSLWAVGGITLANGLEALLGCWLLTRNERAVNSLHTLPEYLRLIFWGGGIASLVGAGLGGLSLLLAGYITPSDYLENATHWWMGDVLGIALLTPFIMVWRQKEFVPVKSRPRLEPLLLVGLVFLAGQIIFLGWFQEFLSDTPKDYWMFLFVAWVAMRLGMRGTTLVVLMIAVQALSGAYLGSGFFAHDIARAGLHNYWAYMLIQSVVGMALAAYVNETREALAALQLKENALNAAGNAISIATREGRIAWANKAFSRLTGYSMDEIIGRRHCELVKSGKQDQAFYQSLWSTILSNKVWQGDLVNLRKDGSLYDEEMTISPLSDAQGEITHFVAVKQDITGRKQVEQLLRNNEARFRSIIEATPVPLALNDDRGNIAFLNKAFVQTIGYTIDDIPTLAHWWPLAYPDPQYRQWVTEMWQHNLEDAMRTNTPLPNMEVNIVCKDGSSRIFLIGAAPIAESFTDLYLVTLYDITDSKAAEDEIRHLAFYDHLTRLPNRRLLMDRLNQALASSARSRHRGALLFIDLDNFKTLNDTLGHDIGDLLLQQVAIRLTACVREGDTVARLGGDEFVVMLEDLGEQEAEAAAQTEAVGEKILSKLNESYQLLAHVFHNSPSIGAIVFNEHQQTVDELLKQADIAMYQAKKAGRNTLRFFDPKMQDAINARAALESELRSALENGQLHLYYQIQMDSSHHPVGAESLIRWIHPEHGMVSPARFIPLAEETGLILPIGLWVLETACAQLKIWQRAPLTRELVLAVNVSAKQFRQSGFVAQVQTVVQRHAIEPGRLKLELTESMLLENIEDTIATMNALKAIGVQFSLDDFGTGYSSLQYLKQLPLDQLKIDQSFVRDIAHDSSDRAIVRTIIAMAHSLNLDVIAEGVETEQQRQLLLDNGCTRYQGYCFSKPVPVEEFEALLTKR